VVASSEEVLLTWVDRSGKVIETVGMPGAYRGIDVSHDGRRIAVHRHDGDGGDVWVLESAKGPLTRQSFDASRDNSSPIWSPDGTHIAFGALRNGTWSVFQKLANGTGAEDLLFESNFNTAPMSWSHDGKVMVLRVVSSGTTQGDEWFLSLADKKAVPLLHEPANELRAQISPDGKWLAYDSDEAGRPEIYVRPFPSLEGKRQISANGGMAARWRGDGRELFYLTSGGSRLVSVQISIAGSTLNYSAPTELFDTGYVVLNHGGGSFHHYAVSPDGQRFLIPRPNSVSGEPGSTPITVILNWGTSLQQ